MAMGIWRGASLVIGAVVWFSDPAVAASVQLFPVKPSLVPVVVAAAFILPAFIASLMSVLRRAGLVLGSVLGFGLLAVMAMVVTAYLDPNLVAVASLGRS